MGWGIGGKLEWDGFQDQVWEDVLTTFVQLQVTRKDNSGLRAAEQWPCDE